MTKRRREEGGPFWGKKTNNSPPSSASRLVLCNFVIASLTEGRIQSSSYGERGKSKGGKEDCFTFLFFFFFQARTFFLSPFFLSTSISDMEPPPSEINEVVGRSFRMTNGGAEGRGIKLRLKRGDMHDAVDGREGRIWVRRRERLRGEKKSRDCSVVVMP